MGRRSIGLGVHSRAVRDSRLWVWNTADANSSLVLLRPYIDRIVKKGGSMAYALPLYLASLSDSALECACDRIRIMAKTVLSEEEQDSIDMRPNCAGDLLNNWDRLPRGHRQHIYAGVFDSMKEALLRKTSATASRVKGRLHTLARTFSITSTEKKILLYLYLMKSNTNLGIFLKNLYEGRSAEFIYHLAVACGTSVRSAGSIYASDSKLVQCGVLEDLDGFRPDRDIFPSPNDNIVSYLNGVGSMDFTHTVCEKVDCTRAMALDEFHFPGIAHDICKEMISGEGGCNILLYGPPGLGKSSYCSALARAVGKNLYKLKSPKPDKELSQLRMAIHSLGTDEDVLLVDEADSFLNTFFSFFGNVARVEKGSMNDLLETHGKKVIWVSNMSDAIAASTRRRFDYSIEFKELDEQQRKNMWNRLINEVAGEKAPFGEEEVRRYFLQYRMSPANMKNIIKASSRFTGNGHCSGKPMSVAREIARQQATLCGISRVQDELKPVQHYSLDHVNTDISLASLVESCRTYLDNRDSGNYPVRNVTMLFYGPPGCGKTEFAKHLATMLKKELLLKKASDILSKWVGGTEQNISAAFQEAETEDKVLLVDEADSLLQDRSGAQRSWEVSQVNELLVQLENFRGIVLFSTNFDELLDKASLRRFSFKVRFGPLRDEHIRGTFKNCFPDVHDEADEKKISAITPALRGATFGDFKVVQYRRALGQIPPDIESIVQALVHEKQSRSQSGVIGF